MKNNRRVTEKQIIFLLGGIAFVAVVSFGFKLRKSFIDEELRFSLNYEFSTDFFRESITIPSSDDRQIVKQVRTKMNSGEFQSTNYSYTINTRSKYYTIDPSLRIDDVAKDNSMYTKSTPFIDSDDPKVSVLGRNLIGDRSILTMVLGNIFKHVQDLPQSDSKTFTSVHEIINSKVVSKKGKNQLFVALCRSLNLQSRIVAGVIVNPSEQMKKAHMWAEVKIENEWVPFDVLHGHFAFIPANYLSVSRGDQFLKDQLSIAYDYVREIEE